MLKKIIFILFLLKITAGLGHFVGKWTLALPISLGVSWLLYALGINFSVSVPPEKRPTSVGSDDDFLKMRADESYAIFGTAGYED